MERQTNITGLTDEQVLQSRESNGSNQVVRKKEYAIIRGLRDLAKEPMVLLLLAAATIYFISGQVGDGIFMGVSILLVAAISLYQDARSRNALEALHQLTEPNAKLIRNGKKITLPLGEIVLGDIMIIDEGSSVPADGIILQANDFTVNEAILTGESMPVAKNNQSSDIQVYQGTTVATGLAICEVTGIGINTKLGQIGKSMESIEEERTPLQVQISSFVKKMALFGIVVFAIVWAINYYKSADILDSLLKSLTLAMSILPEEIPVAFTTFMALGAWRLMKMGIIVKQTTTVEALGSASVICTDKTGTLTNGQMSLARLYTLADDKIVDRDGAASDHTNALIRTAMWASEPIPFDPMEKALHKAYAETAAVNERPSFRMVHEYPLGGRPPMMTHVFKNDEGVQIIAAKGAPEAILSVSTLSEEMMIRIQQVLEKMTREGYRVLGVADAIFEGNDFPAEQQSFDFEFRGLVAFYDPPKENIKQVLDNFYSAGIDVKILTGDNAATTDTIARQVGLRHPEMAIDGGALMDLPPETFEEKTKDSTVFTRVYPEAKLVIINTLKSSGEIVAMTGDGVNDGPALKAAHIGIAMGEKGSEIAKRAASLVLIDDDLGKMVDAIAMGRRIYTNLKKAIRYIISIHIPIILTVFIPLALGWIYPNIFTPVHVIFLELIMGPTCSIIYENEPAEPGIMQEPPRPFQETFFNWRELTTSIIQGLVITAGTLFIYQYAVRSGMDEALTRTMVFITLVTANIFLTLVNRSFYHLISTTIRYKNNLVPLIIFITIALTVALLLIQPLTAFFDFRTPGISELGVAVAIGCISVVWFEGIKILLKLREKQKHDTQVQG